MKLAREIVSLLLIYLLKIRMTVAQLLANPDFKEKYVLQKLLMYYLECTREQMWIDGEREIEPEILNKISQGYKAYVEDKKPLEYIVGSVEFFGTKFIVNENTIIPRPETEYMVQAVTEYVQASQMQDAILMDIGTGSGILGISTLMQNPDNFKVAFLTDLSDKALVVAKTNSDRLVMGCKSEIFFIWTDMLAFVDNYESVWRDKQILLVANLPYIPEDMFFQNSPDNVQKWEPTMAFITPGDGLELYRKMLNEMPAAMKATTTCFFEMMTRQVEILDKEYGQERNFEEVKTFHFNIRIVKATHK